MTDRVKGFTVTLEKDIRIDDVEFILNAVKMIKGIAHVEPSISTSDDHFARQRVKMEMREKKEYLKAKEVVAEYEKQLNIHIVNKRDDLDTTNENKVVENPIAKCKICKEEFHQED